MGNILLSIAIPTYNRAPLLQLCLDQIRKQAVPYSNELEVLVLDNDSTDNTEQVVRDVIIQGLNLTYIKNSENIGAEKNVVECFKRSLGKYILILGDDDLILDSGIDKITDVLRKSEYGVVHLNCYGFKHDYISEYPRILPSGIINYNNLIDFIKRIHYQITFLSGNIINKSFLPNDFNAERFLGTNLPHLNWIVTAMCRSKQNIVINDYIIAAKTENTGGYKLCQVFAIFANNIFSEFISEGANKKIFEIINLKLLSSFFPYHICRLRESGNRFKQENFYHTLRPVYSNYVIFWILVVPIIVFPLSLALFWEKVVRKAIAAVLRLWLLRY